MSSSPNPDLTKITEVFLIPSSFLVAALGTADTNLHRAAVSLLGLLVSGLWWVCSREAFAELKNSDAGTVIRTRRIRIFHWLPLFFLGSWIASLVVHALLWNQPLGHN
jgi:hypothetical protein